MWCVKDFELAAGILYKILVVDYDARLFSTITDLEKFDNCLGIYKTLQGYRSTIKVTKQMYDMLSYVDVDKVSASGNAPIHLKPSDKFGFIYWSDTIGRVNIFDVCIAANCYGGSFFAVDDTENSILRFTVDPAVDAKLHKYGREKAKKKICGA